MKQHPAFKKTTRVCAICGKALRKLPNGSTDTTYGFRGFLGRNGIDGDKAHPSCVKELGEAIASDALYGMSVPR